MPSYSHYLAACEEITALATEAFKASITPKDNNLSSKQAESSRIVTVKHFP
jgi:hypothetical protein